jgi:DNA-binding transcriptional regulator YdaS (Cro superfamily)
MDVKALIKTAGGPTKVARGLGLSHSTVIGWDRIPAAHVPALSRLLNIPRHELRPDMWEAPEVAA